MDFWGKTEKKIFQKFSGIWNTPSRWSVVSGSIYNKQYTMEELIGVIKLFAGEHFVPQGYMECNGQLLPVNQYQALYSILGNTYGGDIRAMTFGLPKLTSPDEHMKYIICVEGVYPPRP